MSIYRTVIMKIYNGSLTKDPDADKAYIDRFPEPRDDIDRAYFQYRCRFRHASFKEMAILNALGFIAIPYYLVRYLINRLRFRPGKKLDAVMINSTNHSAGMTYEDKFPEELYREFDVHVQEVRSATPKAAGMLSRDAFACWFKLVLRHPFSFYLNYYCLSHLMVMNRQLLTYSPRALINYRTESCFASSMMTMLAEKRGCQYICFMHGVYITSLERAFVRFSRMYIWDEHFRKIFLWSRCPGEQLRVYAPGIFSNVESLVNDNPAYCLSYYLSGEDDTNAKTVAALHGLTGRGLKVKIRPHPRFSDMQEIRRVYEAAGIAVEDPLTVPLRQSMFDTRYVAAQVSTVLLQGYYAGKEVVIDDLSNALRYDTMAQCMYISLGKPHTKLSALVETARR